MHEALGGGTKLLALGGGVFLLCAAFLVLAVLGIGLCSAFIDLLTKGFTTDP